MVLVLTDAAMLIHPGSRKLGPCLRHADVRRTDLSVQEWSSQLWKKSPATRRTRATTDNQRRQTYFHNRNLVRISRLEKLDQDISVKKTAVARWETELDRDGLTRCESMSSFPLCLMPLTVDQTVLLPDFAFVIPAYNNYRFSDVCLI